MRLRSLQEHWHRRKRYRSLRGWLLGLYNRALLRKWPLPGRGRVVDVHLAGQARPIQARLGTTDWLVLEEVFFDGEYKIADEFSGESIRAIIDLGANVGYSVVLWKRLFPEARVTAVEPDSGNIAVARQNSGDLPGVTLIEGCAAGQDGFLTLDRSGGEAWAFRTSPPSADGEPAAGERIQAYSMESLIQAGKFGGDAATVDLLKCDIEGGEAELFADCRSWIGRVRHIIIELHRPYDSEKFFADLARGGATVEERRVQDFGNHEVLYIKLSPPPASPAMPAPPAE